ncbi:metallophosphoesterase [Sorangium sp. KYC3313]|uniref:metallophosphoesterase n=1 Tax=Sorangium sp. KYC3313 TaxID=3449740 RepID=UPI003F8CA593
MAIIPAPSSPYWPSGLAFHPTLPRLATVGADSADSNSRDRVIHIWDFDYVDLVDSDPSLTVTYTSAKIVMVGESNVGKSYLAHRVATGQAPGDGTIHSTHGMQFWPLEPEQLSPGADPPENQQRDIVLWDMGGQEEYRLIHQLFLDDTTVALVLLDPTRGNTAFKEVEAWNRYLAKQLQGRNAVRLLVGTKLDVPSDTIDRQGLTRLQNECGFVGFYETSSLTGRGISKLREAIARAIDWDNLGKTSRPELFQRIRKEIEARRKRGDVVVHVQDLLRALAAQTPTQDDERAVLAVAEQLAMQGVIARSHVFTGEPVLVLQVQEIERYAGSLIVAARNNPRGVPALDLLAIAQPGFEMPGIAMQSRLPRVQELPVLECTVELLLDHGICFKHEGLLIFPTLFTPSPHPTDIELSHAVSLYYDFSGAIDNIYASLVAWLVLARDFGRVRLWADRAEFEIADCGICGLRKVGRAGGFAHVDVYFGAHTPSSQQELFISFVEEHLRQHGVEIREHVVLTCQCSMRLDEETIRMRIARGANDVSCPVCELRHSLVDGATEARQRNPKLDERTWALKTRIEKARRELSEEVVQAMEREEQKKVTNDPIRVLHLSDLHFRAETPVRTRLQWLSDDLRHGDDWGRDGIDRLDYLVISGDFTDKGTPEGHERAYDFVSSLTSDFGLSAERCIFVPGNHDVRDMLSAYEARDSVAGLKDDDYVKQGDIYLVPFPEKYLLRLKSFSDNFYHKFLQQPYPTDYVAQGISIPFWETGLQFLTFNSSWQIDRFHRKRSNVHPSAIANALRMAQTQERDARADGRLASDAPLLRIAVWHHAVTGPEQMKNTDFLGNLQKNNVKIALHGDVHEMRRELVAHWHARALHVVSSGSFGAPAEDRPESAPRLYNLIEIDRGLKSVRVHTRMQPKADAPWKGWNEWPRTDGGGGAVPYFDISW